MGTELKTARPVNRPVSGDLVTAMVCLVAVVCLTGAMGCSRLGSNNNLSQRRIPFPQQPLRQANTETPSQTAATRQSAQQNQSGSQSRVDQLAGVANDTLGKADDLKQSVDEFGFDPSQKEFAAVNNSVQNVKARLPKLSNLPDASSFDPARVAEPVIDNVAQVAFQDAGKDFDPSAAPPAQIFSQPLRETGGEIATKTLTEQAANLQSSLATILPAGGSNQFRESDGKTVAKVSQTLESSRQRLDPLTTPPNLRPDSSRRILLLSDDSSLASTESKIQQVSAVEPSAITAIKTNLIKTPTTLNASSPLLPSSPVTPAVTIAAKAPYVTPPVTSNRTDPSALSNVGAFSNGPKVDANLKGEVYLQGSPAKQTTLEKVASSLNVAPKVLEIDSTLAPEKINLPKLIHPPVVNAEADFKAGITDSHPVTEIVEQTNGIEIDPTLGQQRDRLMNFSPAPVEKSAPQPAPVVYQNKKAPFLMLPRIKKVIPEVSQTRIASIKQNDFVAAWDRKEFNSISKCTTCDDADCHGCSVPPENHFAQTVPRIDGGRSLAPMAVELEDEDSQIARKNFGQVAFSSDALPLPQTIVDDAQNIADSFEQQVVDDETFFPTPTQSDVPPVGVDAVLKLNAVTWRSRLQQTIQLVQEQLDSDIDSQTRTSMEINLRLLDVLSRQVGDVAQEERQFTASENQFWQHQLEAITSMLQTSELADVHDNDLLQHHTAHQTLTHLRHAVAQLESLANLKVSSGAFCTEVSGYGQFELFQSHQFESGQKVLVYCEVENYSTIEQRNESSSTFHTKLRGSYAIYDSAGHAVQQAEFPVMEDVARKRRRDFYMHLPITIGDLSAGAYELHLLVEDLGGNKTASLTPPLAFVVAPQPQADLQAHATEGGNWIR